MKNLRTATLVAVLGLFLSFASITSGTAVAQGWQGQGRGMGGQARGMGGQARGMTGHGYRHQRGFAGPALELRTNMYNAQVGILAEMTDQTPDSIKAKLRFKPMWAVLDEYKVDYTVFNEKALSKRSEIIKQAVSDGKISQSQADWMLQR